MPGEKIQTVFYFAYGSNMNFDRMRERDVNFFSRQPAFLPGYRLVFNKRSDKGNQAFANIVLNKTGIVFGILYEIDKINLEKLDFFEKFPAHYYRFREKVFCGFYRKLKSVTAEIYIAQPWMITEKFLPSKKYIAHLLAAAGDLPSEYVKKIKSQPTCD